MKDIRHILLSLTTMTFCFFVGEHEDVTVGSILTGKVSLSSLEAGKTLNDIENKNIFKFMKENCNSILGFFFWNNGTEECFYASYTSPSLGGTS